jgi:hypothetical protein
MSRTNKEAHRGSFEKNSVSSCFHLRSALVGSVVKHSEERAHSKNEPSRCGRRRRAAGEG